MFGHICSLYTLFSLLRFSLGKFWSSSLQKKKKAAAAEWLILSQRLDTEPIILGENKRRRGTRGGGGGGGDGWVEVGGGPGGKICCNRNKNVMYLCGWRWLFFFSSHARILGECSNIRSPPAVFLFFVCKVEIS